jgi:hypothetical protein
MLPAIIFRETRRFLCREMAMAGEEQELRLTVSIVDHVSPLPDQGQRSASLTPEE